MNDNGGPNTLRVARAAGNSTVPDAVLVVASASANIGLSGLAAIDGVTPNTGDLVLAYSQTDPTQNGVYSARSGAWIKSNNTFQPDVVFCRGGTANGLRYFILTAPNIYTINPQTPATAVVRVATSANTVLSGLLTIDGVTLVDGDQILVKNQTTPTQNGVYTVHSGAWVAASPTQQITFVVIMAGSTWARTSWILTAANTYSPGLGVYG